MFAAIVPTAITNTISTTIMSIVQVSNELFYQSRLFFWFFFQLVVNIIATLEWLLT